MYKALPSPGAASRQEDDEAMGGEMDLPWENLLTVELTPEGIEAFLRRHNATAALAAMAEARAPDAGALTAPESADPTAAQAEAH